jgi:hypothetical protein
LLTLNRRRKLPFGGSGGVAFGMSMLILDDGPAAAAAADVLTIKIELQFCVEFIFYFLFQYNCTRNKLLHWIQALRF